jgi:hypothetical protein
MPARSTGRARPTEFDAAPATVVDPHPPVGLLRRCAAREDAEGLKPWDAPTQEAKDVIQALAAHEFSIARARRAELLTFEELELVEELDLAEIEESPELDDDFEDHLPTRIKTPNRRV